jgi:hypothetical protein
MINLEDTTMTKKVYNLPAVEVTHIALESIVLAGSPAASGGAGKVNTGVETDDQW